MNWKNINIVLTILLIGAGFYFFGFKKTEVVAPAAFNPLNATYIIDGKPVTLLNGRAEESAAPGSAAKVQTMVFGEPIKGDLNNDNIQDAAVILVQNSGGSGTFYYVAVAVNTGNEAVGTNAILMGDRIAPQTEEIRNGQLIVNYADRNQGEPMTARPSLGVSKYLNVVNGTLLEGGPIAGIGERCGGNMRTAPTCIAGAHCVPDPKSHLPFGDVGGICAAN